jgi:N-methylhydantoinase A
MPWRVGIDVGGTFTDLTALDSASGRCHIRKFPSTPKNPARATGVALQSLHDTFATSRVAFFAHGTTAGTNALIEHTGARTGLITTEGFRDLLEIARQQRPDLYDFSARKPPPLVPRHLRHEAPERLGPDGSILRPIDLQAVERELTHLAEQEISSLAVCCLHSYANPQHEQAIGDLARRILPDAYVTISSDLLPRFREYERLSTIVVNAYLGPLMNDYLEEVGRRAADAGIEVSPHIMQSSGGLGTLDEARHRPVTTVLSGPAAGAAAANALRSDLDLPRAVSIDMGGTSTDVCLSGDDSSAPWERRDVAGYSIDVPGADVQCIGAGGGSIVSIDPGGLPRVGPASAGASPGPACYGLGGTQPTLTDAFVILGRLPIEGLLGGTMPLDPDAAHRAFATHLAGPLGMTSEQAARGAIAIAVSNVRRAVESMTVRRGRDPRDYGLIAAGGAGPLIACEAAAELGITEVFVPVSPGAFSAWGLLAGDVRRDWIRTRITPLDAASIPSLAAEYRELDDRARSWLEANAPGPGIVLWRAGARYAGQDYELAFDIRPGMLHEAGLGAARRAFHDAHDRCYGYSLPDRAVEIVDLIVTAVAEVGTSAERAAEPGSTAVPTRRETAPATGLPRRDRGSLVAGSRVAGPLIITEYDSTTFLPLDWVASVEETGVLHLRHEESQ